MISSCEAMHHLRDLFGGIYCLRNLYTAGECIVEWEKGEFSGGGNIMKMPRLPRMTTDEKHDPLNRFKSRKSNSNGECLGGTHPMRSLHFVQGTLIPRPRANASTWYQTVRSQNRPKVSVL